MHHIEEHIYSPDKNTKTDEIYKYELLCLIRADMSIVLIYIK